MKRFLWLLLLPVAALADERILDFESDIRIEQDGWIEVRETIRVRAEGRQIRRGIYRDFPTTYLDKRGLTQVVDYRPVSVTRNGVAEDFHSVDLYNGVRTYFGHRDRMLTNGEHTYVFTYRANRMLGFFDDYDEFYWNVTGFDWAFPIDRARARVRFDFNVDSSDVNYVAYTGGMYDKGTDYEARVSQDGSVLFESTRPLSPVNGLTIAVSWPKGFVTEPSELERLGWILRDNRNLLLVIAGTLALLAYNIPVWRRFGRDPAPGVIVTRYEPPAGYSPASLRYIRQMHYDNKTMTAAVVNLAVKGYLDIVNDDDDHSLIKTDPGSNPPALAPGERELYDRLFRSGKRVELKNENHSTLGAARKAHKRALDGDYNARYFRTNGLLKLPSVAIVIGSTVGAFATGGKPSFPVWIGIIVNFSLMLFFGSIMKRPTLRGRKLLDEMLGFEDYLDVAEKDELNLRNPPAKTPELFEAYLPYALALGVEQSWSEKFAAVLARVRDDSGRAYQPAWYQGNFNPSRLAATTSDLSSGLNSAISSSVTPPGSSSGSGGGGFSGGGGGGGGGGGW